MFKVNNKDTRTTSITLTLFNVFIVNFKIPLSSVSNVDFEQVSV